MGVFINIIFFIISFVTLVISGGFLSNSAVRVTQIPQWEKNPNLKELDKLENTMMKFVRKKCQERGV